MDYSNWTETTLERVTKQNQERDIMRMVGKWEEYQNNRDIIYSSDIFREGYDNKYKYLGAYLDEDDPYFLVQDFPSPGIEYQIRPHSFLSIVKEGETKYFLKTNMFKDGDEYQFNCEMPMDMNIVREWRVNEVIYILQGELNKILKEHPQIEEKCPQIIYGPEQIHLKNNKFKCDFINKETWKGDKKIADGVIEKVICDMYSDMEGIFYEVLFSSNVDKCAFTSDYVELDKVLKDPYILRSFYDNEYFEEVLKAFIIDGAKYGLCAGRYHD